MLTSLSPGSPPSRNGARHLPGAGDVLIRAQAGRPVIQDYCPLADSIEWNLGQRYLRERGSKAFISDTSPVPFVVNNDGVLSQNAAHVFFHSLMAADQAGTLEPEIFVLELGIGVGLFARFFLDALRVLCKLHGKDYYDRLTYVAGDRSEQMLQDACRHGVLGHHLGHCVVRVVDALQPEATLANDLLFRRLAPQPFRAVFLNYLLDCLPAADLKVMDQSVLQLCVQTCLGRYANLQNYTSLTVADLTRMAASSNDQDHRQLLELYGMLVAEYDYRPVDMAELPYGPFAVQFAHANTGHVLHNYGALSCLERLLRLLHPQGFILANDYGQTEIKNTDEFEHQRFSHATFVGINFPLLKAYFADGGRCQWAEPAEDNGRIHSRLLGHALHPEVSRCFTERFSKAAHNWLQAPWEMARMCQQARRYDGAVTAYYQALERQPYNWLLMNEAALFLTFTFGKPEEGVAMAREALAMNPACSAELWNTLGDALFACGQVEESRLAFRRALRVNPSDVRARFNLVWVLLHKEQFREALAMVAEALALDETGEYYERLLKKQNEVLAHLNQRKQHKMLMMANRVSHRATAAPPDNKTAVNGSLETTASDGKDAPRLVNGVVNEVAALSTRTP